MLHHPSWSPTCIRNVPRGKPIHLSWNRDTRPVYSSWQLVFESLPISGFQQTGQIPILSMQLILSHCLQAPKRLGLGICCKCRFKSTVGLKQIGSRAWHDQPSYQVRAKVVCCKSLTTLLLDQWLLNHQDSLLAPYALPPTANRWLRWSGVLPLCRGEVSVFYSSSQQDGKREGVISILKLVYNFTYLGSSISSTENDVNICLAEA